MRDGDVTWFHLMHQEDNQRPVVEESQVIFGENLPGKETWAAI